MHPYAPLLIMALASFAPAALPFHPSPVPGGIAVVALPGTGPAPQVSYRNERVLVRRAGKGWQAIVGIPLSAKPGPDALEVDGHKVPFSIRDKRYPQQRLTLKNQRQVTPNPEDEARIAREQVLIAPTWKEWPTGLIASLEFQQPTAGPRSASFGVRRIFNGVPRNPHPGMDIAAPRGRAAHAPAGGVVLLTGDFFFSGNTVIIGHGEGVVSLLCHLTDISVQQGQTLKTGDLIGHVGSTGRATGPHLHWTLSLNNARVDPGLFLP
jgi:murein DD-endopeptidase MepM/ murein hydrolase activator NlpD